MNRANYSLAQIDDSAFVLDGEKYQNYGNYMELELLEEYTDSRFHIDVLIANGLKGRIQGPRRVNELATLLNRNCRVWADEIDDTIYSIPLTGKERDTLIKARVNQSLFREMLLNKHKRCCLCGVSDSRMLIASHIKPWSQSNSEEKVDIHNGLLLCPNHDKAFDNGLITFENHGNILISDELSYNDRVFLNLKVDMKITLSPQSAKYMEYHRNRLFRK